MPAFTLVVLLFCRSELCDLPCNKLSGTPQKQLSGTRNVLTQIGNESTPHESYLVIEILADAHPTETLEQRCGKDIDLHKDADYWQYQSL